MTNPENNVQPSDQHVDRLEEGIQPRTSANQRAQLDPASLLKLTTTAGQVSAALDAGKDVIESVSGLKDAVLNLYNSFEGADAFVERSRKLELVVINATSRRLVWENSFFDTGTTFTGPIPLNILPVDETEAVGATLWAVANSQGTIMSGLSGAGKWQIEGTAFSLVIGFTNPQFGSFKSEIGIVGRDAEARIAYDATDNVEAKQFNMFGFTVSAYADEAKVGADRRLVFCVIEKPSETSPNKGDALAPGEYLAPGEFLVSANGKYAASYEAGNGKLVIHDLNALRSITWSTDSTSITAWRCGLSDEGCFETLEAQDAVTWAAPESAPGGQVKLDNDGVLRLYDSNGTQLWSSEQP